MKHYKKVAEDAEYRELYDSYELTVDNLNDTDFLYKTSLSNGQVFFEGEEVYGFVNNQAALRNQNITITKEYIDNFKIRDFILFNRKSNDLIRLNINCNLANYRDGKPHYLYVVLSHRGLYEVYDDMFQSDEEKILFARFIISTRGDSIQFYMMLPFAGSADYLKGNQFYQVTDGLRLEVVNANTKQLTLSDAKIRFSAINFEDLSSPDCKEYVFNGNAIPIRYVVWDNEDEIPRVDWVSEPVTSLIKDKIMNYETGRLTSVAANHFSIIKLYFDVYTQCIVAMYGDTDYATREDAIYAIDSIMNYPLPDGIEYLIPIAAVIYKNTDDALDENNFRVINLDYNEKEVLDSDTFTRQQAAEAVNKSNQALAATQTLGTDLTNHIGNRANPHYVRLDQLLKSNGDPGALADDYADYSVASILSAASAAAGNAYYSKNGGTINGNASITGTLTVAGTSTLTGNTTISGTLTLGNNLIPSTNAVNVGSSTARIATVYANSINAATSGESTLGTIKAGNINPNSSLTYALGNNNFRWNGLFVKDINASGATSTNSLSVAAGLTGATGTFSNYVEAPTIKVTTNGNLIINGISLRLGSTGSITTQTGYALV